MVHGIVEHEYLETSHYLNFSQVNDTVATITKNTKPQDQRGPNPWSEKQSTREFSLAHF